MLFNTPIFFWFYILFLALYGLVFVRHRARVWLILGASLVFYGTWNYRFIGLLVGTAAVDYYLAQAIAATGSPRRKKWLLAASVVSNLGVLALFKYADFAILSVGALLQAVGLAVELPTLQWVLPVGISFYTFQSLSYTIDVYRGDTPPASRLVDFLASVSFFPQLVAGPILRAREILPQIQNLPTPTWDGAKHGFLLITVGLLKKTVADLLAQPAALAFEGGARGALETWTGVLAFAGQIYGDFSGYSDMAIGLALVLGFHFPLNFRLPYFALSPVDFWRRWHISLSTWLRDYLYIPLGGNRTGGRYRNIFLTMLLGGLWHGAAWTFVAWGAFHGALIAGTHYLASLPMFARFAAASGRGSRLIQWAVTFYLVLIGWVLFRASSLEGAGQFLAQMHGAGGGAAAGSKALLIFGLTLFAGAAMHVMDHYVLKGAAAFERKTWLFWPLMILAQALCLLIGEPTREFIYFQF